MILAPLFFACSNSSNTIVADPSDNTNPSLSLSKGLLALEGLSFCVDSALIFANPDIVNPVMLASVPPVTITSASPYCMVLAAHPIASVPEAQAEITV